jgi:phage protein D
MISLGALLDPGFRQPASCLIEVGEDLNDLGTLAALVTSVEITTARGEAATGTVIIEDRRDENGLWMAADSGLFTRWTPVKVSADFQTHVEEVFRGYVTQAKPSYPNNGGETTLELTLQDESAALDREQMRTVWGEDNPLSDLDILSELVSPLGLSADGESDTGQSSRALSQDATPIVFLRERAKANGFELIFGEGKVYFGPMRLDGEAQAPIMVYAGRSTNCLSLEIVDDGQKPDEVRFDHAPREEGSEAVTETLTPDITVLGESAAADEGAGLGTPSVWRVTKEGDETEEELRARAQALVNENSFKLRATGELDGSMYGHVLKVGRTVTVDGAGARYGGLYYTDKVVHAFSPDGYKQQFELIRNATGEGGGAGGPLSAATSAIASLF